MATEYLPQHPDLDQLRRQARELQRRVRAGDHAAAGDVGGAGPDFPLAGAQLALARRYGFSSWTRLRRHVDAITARSWDLVEPPETGPWADRFVALACLTYTGDDSAERRREAGRLRAADDAGAGSLAAAVVSGDVATVRRLVEGDPSGASAPAGPFGWSPLMYLTYARLDVDESAVLETARTLLDAGADPNDGRFFAGLATPFTVLTGVLGGGEQDQPAHRHVLPLARLLLERGAEANDAQALYNLQFDEDDRALELLFEFGLGRGDGGPWVRLLPDLLVRPRRLVRRLLRWAVVHDQRARVAMLAGHGVDVIAPLGAATPITIAIRNGHRELAARLIELGATAPQLDPVDRFVAAALAGDREAVAVTSADTVAAARRSRPGLVVWAAAQGRIEAVEILLGSGFDIDALARGDVPLEQPWQTALHTAVERNDGALVRRLLELGADRTIRDTRFDATPAEWATHLGHDDLAPLLTD